MDYLKVMVKTRSVIIIFLLTFYLSCSIEANTKYTIHESSVSYEKPSFVSLEHGRYRRASELETSHPITATIPSPASSPTVPVGAAATNTTSNSVDDSNRTTNLTSKIPTATAPIVVSPIPLLGVNGSGILRVNLTGNSPKVSDPILPDDNLSDVFQETPEKIKAEQNLTNLKYDNHTFYNSYFIGNVTYFNEHWANITKPKHDVHAVLSNSHRRATSIHLTFEFPFYGHGLHNITVATGGFIYTGEHVHNWLAATQYIAPLMANFDTTMTNDSLVKLYDDGEKFTALWENVTLQEDKNKKFTFAVTLYKNGDIVFAYKEIPIPIQNINDTDHPVKVGISDAYLSDKIMFFVRRKTIYEYHRVSLKNYEITNGTILKLEALPTCLQYNTCESCVNHETGFNCSWCEQIQRCSSGTDRNKQDWILRKCEKSPISSEAACPASAHNASSAEGSDTAYVTDIQTNPLHDAVINTGELPVSLKPKVGVEVSPANASPVRHEFNPHETESESRVGGVVASIVLITLVVAVGAWLLYAFKNPHTRSGQILIKYRPSQWSWRRGEARYTAATIHM